MGNRFRIIISLHFAIFINPIKLHIFSMHTSVCTSWNKLYNLFIWVQYLCLWFQIDTNYNTTALYVNGISVYSSAYLLNPRNILSKHQLFARFGVSGVTYDFFIYKAALTQRYTWSCSTISLAFEHLVVVCESHLYVLPVHTTFRCYLFILPVTTCTCSCMIHVPV